MEYDATIFVLKVERQRRLERIKQKQSQLQELILQVRVLLSGGSCFVSAGLAPSCYGIPCAL